MSIAANSREQEQMATSLQMWSRILELWLLQHQIKTNRSPNSGQLAVTNKVVKIKREIKSNEKLILDDMIFFFNPQNTDRRNWDDKIFIKKLEA